MPRISSAILPRISTRPRRRDAWWQGTALSEPVMGRRSAAPRPPLRLFCALARFGGGRQHSAGTSSGRPTRRGQSRSVLWTGETTVASVLAAPVAVRIAYRTLPISKCAARAAGCESLSSPSNRRRRTRDFNTTQAHQQAGLNGPRTRGTTVGIPQDALGCPDDRRCISGREPAVRHQRARTTGAAI